MAFKIVVLFATLACASAGYVEPEHQHLSYAAAPVAHYSSAPAVSYSSFTRQDSPKLAVAKTLSYAEPSVHYAAPLAKAYAVHEPALKTIVVLFATLACASAGYVEPEHQHLSYAAAPVAHYSSAPAVSYSSFTRQDSPKLAVAKTLSYAEPSVHYAAPLAKAYAVHEPALKTVVAQPAYTKTVVAQPAYTKTVYAQEPAHVYAHAAPVVAAKTVSYAAPQVTFFVTCLTLASAGYIEHYQGATSFSSFDLKSAGAEGSNLYVSKPTLTYGAGAIKGSTDHATHSKVVSYETKPVISTVYTAPITQKVTYTGAPIQYASNHHYVAHVGHGSECALKGQKLVVPAHTPVSLVGPSSSGYPAYSLASSTGQQQTAALSQSYPSIQTQYTKPLYSVQVAPANPGSSAIGHSISHHYTAPVKSTGSYGTYLPSKATGSAAETGETFSGTASLSQASSSSASKEPPREYLPAREYLPPTQENKGTTGHASGTGSTSYEVPLKLTSTNQHQAGSFLQTSAHATQHTSHGTAAIVSPLHVTVQKTPVLVSIPRGDCSQHQHQHQQQLH
uniref:Uncharacterized protein n=2 Tax=Anopheles atroparvus TaxID=41427 RepID=A0A182IL94_ANOAO